MSNNKQQGGKPKATNGDDVLVGTSRNDNLSGKKGDDQLSGLAGNDKLKGDKGNDLLDGGTGNDVLYGGKGNDTLLGGAGNDVLYGDDGKSKGWGWDKFCWWKPKSDYDDYLDGGAGSDKVYGGRGDDIAVYSMAGNLGAGFKNIGTKDDYDGGTGHDTLVLQLTHGEAALVSVKQDIAAFQKFLDSRASSRGDEFEFKSFNLDVSNFEALRIELVNTGPTARADAGATNEDTLLIFAGPGVLANDSDADHLDVLSVIAGGTTSAKGASVVLTASGGYSYDPTDSLALQQLGAGQTAIDTFSYTITDLGGATATATVSVTVTGVNDAPVANPDDLTLDEDTTLSSNVLANDVDVDSPALTATLVSTTTNGTLAFNANGSFTYAPNADFNGADSFTYKANDGASDSEAVTVSLNVNPVNDAPVVDDEEIVIGGGGEGGDEPASQANPFLISSALLLAGITDPEGDPLFISEVSAVSELGAEVSLVDGNVVYDPTEGLKHLAEGEEVTDTFTYTVSDGQASSARFASFSATSGGTIVTASIRVTGVNDAPVAGADSFTLNEDTTLTANVLGNDVDVDSPSLTATLVDGPAHGALTLNADGSFTYAPTANFFGADRFTYKANDGALDSAVTTVSLAVNDVAEPNPQPPSKVLPSVGPEAQLEYYIRFDDGNGTPEWMQLDGFSWGMATPIAFGSGGAGTGKSVAAPVSLSLGSSQTATELAKHLALGTHLLNVEIEAYAPGGDKGAQLVDQYYFENVMLSKLTTSASSGSAPQEQVSFNYTKFNHSHLEQEQDGSVGDITQDGWDFALSQDANPGPAAQDDAIKAKLDATAGELEYYVTFQGAGGWLELSSFSMGMSMAITTTGGGAGAGKVSMGPATLGLGSSAELLLLTDALTEGKHFTFLEVEAYASGGDKGRQLVDQYYFDTVFVSSFEGGGATGNTVELDFIKFAHGHIEQSATGAALPAIEVGWDISKNESYSVGTDSDLF
jgi:VCBS repeat-containing protein